ncbi:hypothetical protein GPECTOR_63g61 [Gonium pectorale]|uniref:GCK domain-containing protein n=1 Tax=Gonium pectorale TaxID=33097 RepID=A0A150G4C8_GONPE|nr:hypothetical protein GPECTOR_63g61 [Gonium pectorale]|eukprot:KXZ44736.1 hypothetical protein GPECTOR_63g61 [Gonium pectorale]
MAAVNADAATPGETPLADSSSPDAEQKKRECPICVMFREGGCETEFNVPARFAPLQSFMDCGVKGEKGEGNYQDCIPLFETMRQCMQRNPDKFKEVLKDVDELAATNTEYPPVVEDKK